MTLVRQLRLGHQGLAQVWPWQPDAEAVNIRAEAQPPGAYTYWNGGNGSWSTAGDWSTGKVPNANTNTNINSLGQYTISVSAKAAALVLTVRSLRATLEIHSDLTVTNDVYDGTGTITVGSGGELVAKFIIIAANTSAKTLVGQLNVSNGGVVSSESFISIGGTNGSNGTMNVTNSGTVTTIGMDDTVGNDAGASGTVTISGEGSIWIENGQLLVGNAGNGILSVSNGGSISAAQGLIVGASTGGVGTLVVETGGMADSVGAYQALGSAEGAMGIGMINGSGSLWKVDGGLFVGDAGAATLAVSSGGMVIAGQVLAGNQSTGVGSITIDGSGSSIVDLGQLAVGASGNGTVVVSNDGSMNVAGAVIIGASAGAMGSLTVESGGTITSTASYQAFGSAPGAVGTGSVDGVNSVWNVMGNLTVGDSGVGSLSISDAGRVAATQIVVGYQGSGTVTIISGAALITGGPYDTLGAVTGAFGEVSISGADSVWQTMGQMTVGDSGNGSLSVASFGTLSDGGSLVVGGANGGEGTVSVGSGGTLITAGPYISIGAVVGASGNVFIDGSGSVWQSSGQVVVGDGGTGTLSVSDGGMATIDAALTVGNSSGGTGNVLIAGEGVNNDSSELSVDGSLTLGQAAGGGDGTLTVSNGGSALIYGNTSLFSGSMISLAGGSFTGSLGIEIAKGATISGFGTATGTLVDAGVISADGGTLVLAVGANALTGAGVLSATENADLKLSTGVTLTESTSGDGTLELGGIFSYILADVHSFDIANLKVDAGSILQGYGTIGSDINDVGTIISQGGTLVLDGAVTGSGGLQANTSAVMDLTVGGPLNQYIFGTGTLELGGAFTLGSGQVAVSTIAIDSGASLAGHATLQSAIQNFGVVTALGGTLTLGGSISGTGSLTAAAKAVLDLTSGGVITEAVSGAGTLKLDGTHTYTVANAAALTVATLAVNAGASLVATGTFAGKVVENGYVAAGSGKLTLSGALSGVGMLSAPGGAVVDLTAGGTLNNSFTGAGTLELGGAYVSGTGAISIANLLIDEGASITGDGAFTDVVTDNGTINAIGGSLTDETAIAGSGTLEATAGASLVLAVGGSFSGALAGTGFVDIEGALALNSGASLTGSNIVVTDNVTLGASTALTEARGATVSLNASAAQTLSLTGPGSASFSNAGSLMGDGAGTADFNIAFINTGIVSGNAGTLAFLGTVGNNGTISTGSGVVSIGTTVGGTGALDIAASGTMSLLLGANAGQTVDFAATSGLLDLTNPADFLGAVSSFGGGDKIDLINTPETNFTYANGELTVKDGTQTEATLHFDGTYTKSDFAISNDGHGGTIIAFG